MVRLFGRAAAALLFVSLVCAQAPPPAAPEVELELAPAARCETEKDGACRLGDSLTLTSTNLVEWIKADSKHDPKSLTVFLNGRPVKGLPMRISPPDQLKFDLKRLDTDSTDGKSNREAWTALLGGSHGDQRMEAGIGLNNVPYPKKAAFTFRIFPSWAPVVYVFMAALLIFFLVMAKMTDIVRDASPDPGPNQRRSYSLARCQMAWWFFLVLGAFNYIWMVTGDRDSLTPGVLTLIGISAATGFGAVMVDNGKRDQRQKLQAEIGAINERLPVVRAQLAAAAPPANAPDLQAELQQKTQRLAEAQSALGNLPSPPGPSQKFLDDILKDEGGISFHRFQIAVWTIVLGFVLVIEVYNKLSMPDFSATMLGLMGISAGTYVGFKIPDPPK